AVDAVEDEPLVVRKKQARRRLPEPAQVTREGKRLAVAHLARLEDAVADNEAVVVRADDGRVVIDDRPVHPKRHSTSSSRLTLSSVSSHSRAGSLPQVIPAPVPR